MDYAAGQLTNLLEPGADGVTVIHSTDIGYDLAGRITSEILAPTTGVPVLPAATQTFDVDNRLLIHNGQATSFDLDGNLLTLPGVTPASYTYDARNRLTAAGGLSYTYDSENICYPS